MTWFKVDDKLRGNRKVRKLGADRLPAMGLWTLAGSWAADNVSDGFVPVDEVRVWDARLRFARRLVTVGLWIEAEVDGEPGFRFHDWHDFNPSSEKVLADRNASKERQKRFRERRRNGVTDGVSHKTPTRPDPSLSLRERGTGAKGSLRSVDAWCGECDERTRQIELDDGRPKRCPACHPQRSAS
ncbi:hypothetical protein VSH64_24990 [Amycolatopsis rhabdoformis]|uniref:Uncharacterized protein n=1 Tax=Amycolatopsis rhabdoformis TaxID=1448059 RepID=A0ABZ1HVP0_9PSEU|nr:hypothetical protein [Amycolatopsis rhabdoformis]WSE26135.1 hypothetical protein VSH64_24990 [Amycolatopsis rhabdoformis]